MQVFPVVLLLVADSLATSIKQKRETGPPCPLPPVYIGTEGPLNITYHPILEIHQGGTHRVSTINGLNTFIYEYTINFLTLTAEFTITVGSLSLDTTYTATGYLDARPFSQGCIPSGNFTGNGAAKATIVGLRLVGNATIVVNLMNEFMYIRLLAVSSFSFTSVMACFDSEFAANNAAVVAKMRLAVNEKLFRVRFQDFLDFLDGGDTTCPPPTY
ncbi:hypothetical protein Fcan01_25498 [Folsomia candida]|uniref:Secreted protein n=1 Tax=Folsomia candida TaxID=158441 RepID=A0A226D3F3_FOLCA|nr:hypothetical protein Fcan01_25498 [Folsomia candida]